MLGLRVSQGCRGSKSRPRQGRAGLYPLFFTHPGSVLPRRGPAPQRRRPQVKTDQRFLDLRGALAGLLSGHAIVVGASETRVECFSVFKRAFVVSKSSAAAGHPLPGAKVAVARIRLVLSGLLQLKLEGFAVEFRRAWLEILENSFKKNGRSTGLWLAAQLVAVVKAQFGSYCALETIPITNTRWVWGRRALAPVGCASHWRAIRPDEIPSCSRVSTSKPT
ncbi:hypothetical protein VTK26DRAFT_5521 [Humicola hyalothermophila]